MTFDEFLLSNETIFNYNKSTIIKVKDNENIDFIYKSTGEFESGSNLECIGFFEKNSKKLYGDYSDYRFLSTNFYEATILDLKNRIINECNVLLDDYVKNNTSILKAKGKAIFNEEICFREVKDQLIRLYIYGEDYPELKFNMSVSDFYLELKPLLVEYVQRPNETVEKIFLEYINEKDIYLDSVNGNPRTRADRIGLSLVTRDFKIEQLNEIKKNPDNLSRKKHDIINAIKDINGQMLTLTIKHKETIVSFKYPRDKLYNFYLNKSYIQDLEARKLIGDLYGGGTSYSNQFFSEDIVSISYKKQILYEDRLSLNSKSFIQETHDIVDDMFE